MLRRGTGEKPCLLKATGASHLPGTALGPFILRFLNLILHAVFHSSKSLSALVLFGTPKK